jgi:DNA-binding response OmpR family regulator
MVNRQTPYKILLIDDDPDIRDIYEEILRGAGYLVECVDDGEKGYLSILRGGYDLILLDIMMPKLDGIAILRQLKQNPVPSTVSNGPIFVLSQLNQDEIVKGALALGAKGYLVKSDLNPDELITKIGGILQNNPQPHLK